MAGHLSVDEIAPFAQRAAQAVGSIAVRWWRSPSDPRFLQIEAHRQDVDPPQSMELRTFVGTNAPRATATRLDREGKKGRHWSDLPASLDALASQTTRTVGGTRAENRLKESQNS